MSVFYDTWKPDKNGLNEVEKKFNVMKGFKFSNFEFPPLQNANILKLYLIESPSFGLISCIKNPLVGMSADKNLFYCKWQVVWLDFMIEPNLWLWPYQQHFWYYFKYFLFQMSPSSTRHFFLATLMCFNFTLAIESSRWNFFLSISLNL